MGFCSVCMIYMMLCNACVVIIGASHARGSVILFLHADTLLPRGYANHVMRHMQGMMV